MTALDEEGRAGLVIVARAVRTRGLKGELVAELLTDFPDRFQAVSQLWGVGPDGQTKLLELEDYWFQQNRIILKFSGSDSIETATELVGFEFGVPEAERVQLSENEYYDWELAECVVELRVGATLGRVKEVLRTGGVEVLVVDGPDGNELLIPMAAEIVVQIDIGNKRIVVDPPEGLLEL